MRIRVGQGIAGSVAESGATLNIKHAYSDQRFSKKFDKVTGFKTKSILAIAVINLKGEILGVIQLVNKKSQWNTSDMGSEHFTSADSAIMENFAAELAEVLSKHTSQLQVMKSIADAHSEDYKRRRASR